MDFDINSEVIQVENATFAELGLPQHLLTSYKSLSFIHPTPIQYKTISIGIEGKDIIAQSKAGTGKTLSFLSVVFSRIDYKFEEIQALILVPTRELALQVYDVAARIIKKFPKDTPEVEMCLSIGGIPLEDDRNTLRKKVHIVIGTAGRVLGLIKEKSMKLGHVSVLVLDEADKMINKGMKDELGKILAYMDKKIPQTLAFSATYTPETFDEIKKLGRDQEIIRLHGEMSEPVKENELEHKKIDINVKTLAQYYVKIVPKENERVGIGALKSKQVIKLLKEIQYEQAIIFYNDKGLAEELESDLKEEGIFVHFIHGDQTQAERIRIMNKLKLKKLNVILSTDLLSRGIDIENIGLVINFDVPINIETYFHRVGRTGRFGKYGASIIFLTEREESFILNNKDFFVNIKELPEDVEEVNNFIKQNEKPANIEVENKLQSSKKKKKEYFYGPDAQISDWKEVDHDFYDTAKYKYFEEEEERSIVVEPPKDGEQIYLPMNHHDHQEDEKDYWAFLKCSVCYNYLLQSETMLGRKFEILKYFNVNN